MQKTGIILLIIIVGVILINSLSYKPSNTYYYKKDSVFYKQKDSIHNIIDTSEVIIKELHKTYEKRVEIIKHMPIDSAYIFWANYIQRFDSNNDTATVANN